MLKKLTVVILLTGMLMGCAGAQNDFMDASAAQLLGNTGEQGTAAWADKPQLVNLEQMQIKGKPVDNGAWVGRLRDYTQEELFDRAYTYQAGPYHAVDRIAVQDVKAVKIESTLCGLVIEPAQTGNFEIAYYGNEPNRFTFRKELQADGTLTLTAKGNSEEACYINTNAEKRVNTYVIRVPQKVYGSFTVQEGVGIATMAELGTPVNATADSGAITVRAEQLSSAYTLQSTDGWITVEAGEINGKLKMHADDGWVTVNAKTMTAGAELSAQDGWVTVTADQLSDAKLSAQDGWVTVQAGELGDASLTAQDGWVTLDAGSIVGDVTADAQDGWSTVHITRKPVNLTLTLTSEMPNMFTLPAGWKLSGTKSGPMGTDTSTYSIGSGKPKMQIRGEWVELSIAK